MGEDQTPPSLIKTAVNFTVEPFTDIISSCFSTSTFPDLAERASVTPIDIGGVLNTFSKIIDSSIFDQLTNHANKFLQIFVAAYKNYTAVNIF